MCNDLFQELQKKIPNRICISDANTYESVRKRNFSEVKRTIKRFVAANSVYSKAIKEIYQSKIDNNILEEIVISYIFFLANTEHKNIDIFKDKKSICYSEISLLDLLRCER